MIRSSCVLLVAISILLIGYVKCAKIEELRHKYGPFKCRLYETCEFEMPIDTSHNFDDLLLSSSDTNVFNYEENNGDNEWSNTKTYKIKINPVQVGKAHIHVKSLKDELSGLPLADIVVIRPTRVQDIIFDVIVWVYVGVYSLNMGLLIDKKLIRNMLSISVGQQKTVGLIFFCKYLIMPAVNNFF